MDLVDQNDQPVQLCQYFVQIIIRKPTDHSFRETSDDETQEHLKQLAFVILKRTLPYVSNSLADKSDRNMYQVKFDTRSYNHIALQSITA